MNHQKSDDLLLKSQLLISKFRKQREASLRKQETIFNRPTKDFTREFTLNKSWKSSISPYMVYSHGEFDGHSDDGSSTGSAWSEGIRSIVRDTSNNNKRECGVMTEVNNDDDDLVTPITALPTTNRLINTQHQQQQQQQQQPELSKESKIKNQSKFVSICTAVENEPMNEGEEEEEEVVEEEGQISDALKLYGEEKQLEEEITNQIQQVNQITNEISRLSELLDCERRKVEELKEKKQRIASQRLRIFTNISHTIQNKLEKPPEFIPNGTFIQNEQKKIDQELTENPMNTYHNEVNESVSIHSNDLISPATYKLDKRTINKIVSRIVENDASCTDDDELLTHFVRNSSSSVHSQQTRMNGETSQYYGHKEELEECVLSDVMSVKDLQLPISRKNSYTDSQSSVTTVKLQRPVHRRPPRPKKLRTAQSMDNLAPLSQTKHMNSLRQSTRSPAVSEGPRIQYLHQSNSSSDTM